MKRYVRSVIAFSLFFSLVTCMACSDDDSTTPATTGGSQSGGSAGSNTGATAGTSNQAGSGGTAQAGSGGSSGATQCGSPTLTAECDACVATNCCTEGQNCAVGTQCDDYRNCIMNCIDDITCLDECDSTYADAIEAHNAYYSVCQGGVCNNKCAGNICNSGLNTNDPAMGACLGETCCDEYNQCTQNGTDTLSCLYCMYDEPGSDPTLCAAVKECQSPTGAGASCIPYVCDSGVRADNKTQAECASEHCCAEFNTCSNNGTNVQACYDCFQAEGGPLCDGVYQCITEHCSDSTSPALPPH